MSVLLDIPTIAAAGIICVCFYKLIIYPTFLSPLSKIPNAHPTASISPAWILWTRWTLHEIRSIHEAHQRLGPVVRLGPQEISVNCVKGGIQTVYSGGFEKHKWYSFFANYGIPNMFSTTESKPHSVRKRMLSNIYSKSALQNSIPMSAKTRFLLRERFLPTLARFAESSAPFNIYEQFSAVTMDFVTSYQFGLASAANLMRDEKQLNNLIKVYHIRSSYNFWPQELPRFTSFMKRFGIRLVPTWVDAANHDIETWVLKMCSGAAVCFQQRRSKADATEEDICNIPEVYSQLKVAMDKNTSKSDQTRTPEDSIQRMEIASEVLDHLAAGFDTSGITLVYFVHEISRRPELQTALRKELRSLDQPLLYKSESGEEGAVPSAKALDALPLLQATLQETLRLRAAIPGPEPRITPMTGCVLGPNGEFHLPGGIRVSAQAHSLHRNPEVFQSPEQWIPDRWLKASDNEQLKEMQRWFWAFGSGGRMCVGSNLAIYQMKYIIASIYTNFTTTVVDDEGIEQKDLYTAPPRGGKLFIKLEAATV